MFFLSELNKIFNKRKLLKTFKNYIRNGILTNILKNETKLFAIPLNIGGRKHVLRFSTAIISLISNRFT